MDSNADIGWRVIDRDGNVVDSGPVTVAEMTGEAAELLGLTQDKEV